MQFIEISYYPVNGTDIHTDAPEIKVIPLSAINSLVPSTSSEHNIPTLHVKNWSYKLAEFYESFRNRLANNVMEFQENSW
jgi:hypothetical protein